MITILLFPEENKIPLAAGTQRERGLLKWNAHLSSSTEKDENKTESYEIPLIMDTIRR